MGQVQQVREVRIFVGWDEINAELVRRGLEPIPEPTHEPAQPAPGPRLSYRDDYFARNAAQDADWSDDEDGPDEGCPAIGCRLERCDGHCPQGERQRARAIEEEAARQARLAARGAA